MTINVETCFPRALSEEAKLVLAYFYYLILYAVSSTKAPLQFIMGSERTFYLNLLVGVVNCSLNNLKYVLRGRLYWSGLLFIKYLDRSLWWPDLNNISMMINQVLIEIPLGNHARII